MGAIPLRKSMKNLFFIVALLLTLASCSPEYRVATNAFVDWERIPGEFPLGSTFAVVSPQKGDVLFAKEVKRKIETLLQERGYFLASSAEANYSVVFDFGMTSSTSTVNVPRYLPGKTETKEGSSHGSRTGHTSYSEKKETTGTVVYVQETYTSYRKAININVYEGKGDRTPVWSGNAASSWGDDDLRAAIDYLLVSAFRYFGRNTGEYIYLDIKKGDEAVQRLKGQ